MQKKILATAAASMVACFSAASAHAQSSATLYGIVDAGIGYQNSSGSLGQTSNGHSAVKMINGVWAGSRFGLKGNEDLGGGTAAIFQLEQGFNSITGAQGVSGLAFNRQAWVGVTNPSYGVLTAGRQYTAYFTLLSPWSPTRLLTGYFGAHPGDIDALDVTFRVNNELVYMSPSFYGLTIGGSYALGGQPGSLYSGSTWSAGAQYKNGPAGIAVGVLRVNNSTSGGGAWGASSTLSNNGTQPSVSALNNGYQFAQAQQRVAVTGGWQFSPQFDVSVAYSNVQYIPGIHSGFASEAVFNTAGVVLHSSWSPALDFAAGYSYTHASKANGTDGATYHQVTLSQYYSLSKRTGLYLVEAWTHASGNTLDSKGAVIAATPTIGDGFNSTPGTSSNMVAVGAGIVHRF
jgi:predicted porin